MILITGNAAFDDICRPLKGKNEWGLDTLVRKVKGDRALAQAYINRLGQGQTFSVAGSNYFLQSWDPDDDPVWATITLNYKGLVNGTPQPIIESEIVSASGSKSANYSLENGGKGKIYRKEVTYGTGAQSNVILGTKDIYTTGASIEFTYEAAQSTYRYITVGKPRGPRYSAVDIEHAPQMKEARVTTADGAVYGKEVPAELGPSLLPAATLVNVGFSCRLVFGTPFYECQETVRQELV